MAARPATPSASRPRRDRCSEIRSVAINRHVRAANRQSRTSRETATAETADRTAHPVRSRSAPRRFAASNTGQNATSPRALAIGPLHQRYREVEWGRHRPDLDPADIHRRPIESETSTPFSSTSGAPLFPTATGDLDVLPRHHRPIVCQGLQPNPVGQCRSALRTVTLSGRGAARSRMRAQFAEPERGKSRPKIADGCEPGRQRRGDQHRDHETRLHSSPAATFEQSSEARTQAQSGTVRPA